MWKKLGVMDKLLGQRIPGVGGGREPEGEGRAGSRDGGAGGRDVRVITYIQLLKRDQRGSGVDQQCKQTGSQELHFWADFCCCCFKATDAYGLKKQRSLRFNQNQWSQPPRSSLLSSRRRAQDHHIQHSNYCN